MIRVRIRFTKLDKIRWTSHRDVARMWERAFRRVQLPVAYSEGFSPRPKVSFGLALPTGHESVAEYLDVELVEQPELDLRTLPGRLSAALPVGVDATAAEQIPAGARSLQEDVTSSGWRWAAVPREGTEPLDYQELSTRVDEVLAAPSLVITRERKGTALTDDIRSGLLALQLGEPVGSEPSYGVWLEAELTCHPRTLRPSEVLIALHPDLEERHVRRTHQWILRGGTRTEPLVATAPLGTPDPSPALARLS
jgi:radical SAM-linked protein